MADQTMTVVDAVKAGVLNCEGHASALAGNAAGSDDFIMPNDGRTVLVVVAGASVKTISVTAIDDKYGRTETLTLSPTASKTNIFGPFLPELWNNSSGQLIFKPATGGDVGDKYLAVRVANPS
jgi:hypothetical protein